MVRHGTHGRSTAARPPHPLTHKKTRLPRTPTCSPRPHPFPEKPPRLCPAPKNCRRRTFVAPPKPTQARGPCSWPRTVCPHHRPNRNAPQPVCPLLVGQTGVAPEPTALAGGTAAPSVTQKPPQRQAPARGPVAVSPLLCPKRNAPQPVCPLLVGQTGVAPEPTALAAGTAGLTREGRSGYNRDSRMMWEVLPHVCSGRPGQSGP